MRPDFYQVLGVSRQATATEIRAAFVRLVKLHHPDAIRNADLMPHRIQEIQQAYRCLTDLEARASHDQALDQEERLHFDRQRQIRRRLNRYDRRHPHTPPYLNRRSRWRAFLLMLVAAGLLILTLLSVLT